MTPLELMAAPEKAPTEMRTKLEPAGMSNGAQPQHTMLPDVRIPHVTDAHASIARNLAPAGTLHCPLSVCRSLAQS